MQLEPDMAALPIMSDDQISCIRWYCNEREACKASFYPCEIQVGTSALWMDH